MSTLFDNENQPTASEAPTQEILVFAPEEKPVVSKFDMEQRVLEIVAVCTQAITINDDATNDYARQVGKNASLIVKAIDKKRLELNELPKKEIEANNAVAKKLSAPIETQIERIRLSVSSYELDKEKKRLAELKKIDDEKRAKEEAERKERDRVQGIKQNILQIKNKACEDIDKISDSKSLAEFENKFNGWKPKEEFYAEFIGELNTVRQEITERIKARKVIIDDLEKSRKEAERLKGVAKKQAEQALAIKKAQLDAEKAQADADKQKKEVEEKAIEIKANQDLTIYLATLGVKEVPKRVDEFVLLFGSAKDAMNSKDKIVEKINTERIDEYNSKNLKADKVKNQRTEYKFTVLDETLVPREFMCVDEAKIKKAITENREALEKDLSSFKIEGVQIFPETKTVFK